MRSGYQPAAPYVQKQKEDHASGEHGDCAVALSQLLSSTIVMTYQVKGFHWNSRDESFYELHKFFQENYEAMDAAIDEIAERIAQMNYIVPTTFTHHLEKTLIKEVPTSIDGRQNLRVLEQWHTILEHVCNENFQKAEQVHDYGSQDIFLQQMKFHAKYGWLTRRFFSPPKEVVPDKNPKYT
jgi:starvation-inducible DNA-binding protein